MPPFVFCSNVLLCIGCAFFAATLNASPSALPGTASRLATDFPEANELAHHPEWLALLHYEISPRGKVRQSYVSSSTFFLSQSGKSDPAAELHATLRAFLSTAPAADDHPMCRFPARLQWLKSNTQFTFNTAECPNLDNWAELEAISSISMVFATGHFSSPASFFGHNFLKINKIDSTDYLLDTAINFGAQIPPNENPITYLATGIFGGYKATYSAEPFYRFLAKYGEKDLRDVWEYQLALNTEQLSLLVLHLWELQDVLFPYFFFRENCAYHIATLLNLFTNKSFVPRYLPWAMPITVFDNLMSTEVSGKPLVSEIKLHRSRRSQFQSRFAASSTKLKHVIHQYSIGQTDLHNASEFQALGESDQVWVIDTLLDYAAFMSAEKDGDIHKENHRQLLIHRLNLAPGAAQQPVTDLSEPPHLGQRPVYTAIGVNKQRHGKSTGFLQLRPAYFDFLGLEIGRKPHASFTLFDAKFKLEETISLDSFDLVSISNLNTQFSGISIDKAPSWQLRIANEAVSDRCDDCNAWFGQWDVGKAKKIGNNLAAFALAGISVSESRNKSANGAVHFQLGITGNITSHWRLFAKASYVESFNNHQAFQTAFEMENRFGNSRWWDVRLKMRARDELNTTLSAAIYW